MIGPIKVPCKQALSNTETTPAIIMWVAGFASAANRLGKPDVLQGRTINDVMAKVMNVCDAAPRKTMEEVAIEVVGTFRMEWVERNPPKR
jgi:hypothetical protein